jgi:ABC-type transport system substrate-binding protein
MRASDFRRGMQRQLSFGANPPYYKGILGAPACEQHPGRCDLSAGIVTDDAAGTVTFRLSHADPDFLYKLALPLASPAPPSAPTHAIDRAPFLPGTGPYVISQFRLGKSLTLARNPYFRQWSYAAQPAGYPDVIRYEHVTSQSTEESAVIACRADLTLLHFDDQSLAIQYPARIHVGLKLGTLYAFLNTRQPPFTNLKARRAINYAIDRRSLLRLFGFAQGQATATCQMLPADFPGHYSYCPYTTGAQDGAWHGPDMQAALHLARESHTTNVPVTVWSFDTFPYKAANTYLVQLLRKLGYRASLHAVPVDKWVAAISHPRTMIQMGLGEGFSPDFPDPSTFFGPC